MNYVYATVSYQDGRNIKYADSLGIGRTMGEAEKNLKDTLFKYNPKARPYYNDIYDAQSHHQNYNFELEDVFTELRGLDKYPELMQILLDYLPRAIIQKLPGVKVVSDATMETTPNGFKVSVDLMDKNGNKFTLDVGYGGNHGIHVSIFSKEDNRYVSDTAKGYPPSCPDIKKLLDQYYKHLNNESLTNKRRQPMKRFECSMQKKKESISKILPKKYWLDEETLLKEISDILDSEGEDIKKDVKGSGGDPYFTELALEMVKDSGYYRDLVDGIQEDMYKYINKGGDYKIPGNFERINWSWDEDHKNGIKFNELRKKLLDGIDDADTQEFSTWGIDWFFKAFGTFGITYKFRDMINDIADEYENEESEPEEALKKGESIIKRPVESFIGEEKILFKDTEIPNELKQVYNACNKRFTCEPSLTTMVDSTDMGYYKMKGNYGSNVKIRVEVEREDGKFIVTVDGLDETTGYSWETLGKGESEDIKQAIKTAMDGVDKNLMPFATKIQKAIKGESKKSEARNSGWSEEDSEAFAAELDSDTSLEEIKDLLKDEPYFEENPDEIDDVASEILDYIGESKKSEAENPKDVIGDELPYGMMQYRDPETKEWLPILVSINYNDRGWFYEGLAPSDNFGNFSYEEFNRGFLKTCKSGTDKCDQELVNSMKKFFTDSSMDIDKMPTKEVTNLTAYIPKGKPYIGKE